MLRSAGWLAWTIVAYLLAAAAFELVLALRHSASADGEGFVLFVALIAMLTGAVLVPRRLPATALFAPVAALFVTARFYTGDPYYGSFFRTYADGGAASSAWVFGLLGLGLLAGITTQLWRRRASVETAAILLLLAFTAFFMGGGH